MSTARFSIVFFMLNACCAIPLFAAECSVNSPSNRVALLELYTSEGCSSCPPADRWLSRLEQQGFTAEKVIPVALHIDYWDYIGWKDRFASASYSARQRQQAGYNRNQIVYTPQVMLNGQDFRGWRNGSTLNKQLAEINNTIARADIALSVSSMNNTLSIKAIASSQSSTSLYMALVESGLSTQVMAGENRGVNLNHDHVVRRWLGPFDIKGNPLELQRELAINSDWNLKNMRLVGFVQNSSGSEILQAVALDLCL